MFRFSLIGVGQIRITERWRLWDPWNDGEKTALRNVLANRTAITRELPAWAMPSVSHSAQATRGS
jgi:hypothetical protein